MAQQRCETVSEGKTNLLKGLSDNDNKRRGGREAKWGVGKTGNDSAKHEGAQMEGMPGNEI